MICQCSPTIEVRRQPEWNPGRDLYGYGVAVTVRVHRSPCDLCDEVLHVSAVRVTPLPSGDRAEWTGEPGLVG
jgi:hypothetical protein